MVKIRLARIGTKKTPVYRIVAADSRAFRDGRHLERLGTYNPRVAGAFTVNYDRVKYWQSVGAQLSEELTSLLKRHPAPAAQ
ncbi:MAG: 30S ribosomal protein S16 [Polyangiales bacterium]